MKVIDNPICPKCKDEEILWQEVISMHYDDEGVYLKVRGECLECGTEYEWVEHYVKLGFDKIALYDNDELDAPPIMNWIEPKYHKYIQYFDIRGVHKEKLQHSIYTSFYQKYNKTFDWCLFCDIDEFLVGVNNIKTFLSQRQFTLAQQIRIKWRLFGDDDLITRDMTKPLIQSFTKEIKHSLNRDLIHIGNLERQGKMIIRGGLKNVIIRSPHFGSIGIRERVIPSVLPSGRFCISKVAINENYSHETVFLNHYMTKSLSEFVHQKLNRTDAIFAGNLKLDYFWRINKKTPEKIAWLKERGLINGGS